MSSSKTAKMGLSKDNLNQIINALGTAVLYKLINGAVTIDEDTTNLTELKEAIDEAVASVNNKVNPDDICPELRAGYAFTADNLNATKGLTVNDDPMSFGMVGGAQKSAVGDGNASLNKLVCVDVVRNQLYGRTTNFSKTVNGVTFSYDASTGFVTLNGTATGLVQIYDLATSYAVKGHKNLAIIRLVSGTYEGGDPRVFIGGNGNYSVHIYNSPKIIDFPSSADTGTGLQFFADSGAVFNNCVMQIMFIDLTQCYGSNEVVNAIIGTTASEHVSRLLAFDPEILNDTTYDAGTLVPSKTAKFKAVGYNLFNLQALLDKIGDPITAVSNAHLNNNLFWENTINYQGRVGVIISGITLNSGSSGSVMFLFRYTDGSQSGFYALQNAQTAISSSGKVVKDVYITYENVGSYNFANANVCVFFYLDGSSIGYKPYKEHFVTIPNYEGHGILKVVDDKVVADGTELYPDGNSKKRWATYTFTGSETLSPSICYNTSTEYRFSWGGLSSVIKKVDDNSQLANAISTVYVRRSASETYTKNEGMSVDTNGVIHFYDRANNSNTSASAILAKLTGKTIAYELATEEDITTPVFQSTFPVEQGGTLQFLDEDDNPIAGLQGSEIFYQKNIKAFVEALGEATDWDPERIKRLGNLSFTPEYVDITLNPSPTGAYARAQVYNATFTIVISAALTGTANGSITFQDSEVDLTNFQTKPAESIYDMDGKKVSEAPTTADCNIASFAGRHKSGIILWSLLHSGVNKVKIHIEEAVPLDSEGNGKIDCRASLIL